MTTRDVTINSKTITNENWAYSLYVFELLSDIAVAGTAVYPTSVHNVRTDENGSGLVSLAVPDSSAWQYKVTLPNGSTCTFALEAGAAITLAEIIANGCDETVPVPDYYIPKNAAFVTVGATYTTLAADGAKPVNCPVLCAVTLADGMDSGFQQVFNRTGSGVVTITADTTLQHLVDGTGLTTIASATLATTAVLLHLGSDVWLITGDYS